MISSKGSFLTALKKYSSNSAMTTSAKKFIMMSIIVKLVNKAAKLTNSTTKTLKLYMKPQNQAI